jgi:uroporphyrinogen decarboxylase
MRQAGRCLPEYRALKEKHTFRELIADPRLAAEVTLQPVRRFHFDAAILFCDILVIPEALGRPFEFSDQGGLRMETIKNARDIARLQPEGVVERLAHVAEALRLVKTQLAGRTGLLGFAGSPWTLANFMLDGGSGVQYARALELFRNNRAAFNQLSETLARATAEYLKMQIQSGADAVQIFDSLAGLAPESEFEEVSARWVRDIVSELGGAAPVIYFAKGSRNWPAQLRTGAQVLGIDHEIEMADALAALPGSIGVQGNLNPALLSQSSPEDVRRQTLRLLETTRGRRGHIFNLGHGVPPDAKLENIEALVAAVRSFA